MLLSILLLAFSVTAMPMPDAGTMSDCDMCFGIVVQYRRSPTSLVMCSDERCTNITSDVMNLVLNPYFESEYYTPDDICAELNYCVDYDTDEPPVIIDFIEARRSFFEDLSGGNIWGEFP